LTASRPFPYIARGLSKPEDRNQRKSAMQEEQQERQQSMSSHSNQADSSRPPCCGSGCAVCVLDYWEDETPAAGATEAAIDAEILLMLPMLEAFEEAQQTAGQIIVPADSDLS
jgi:hypothetical protein